ncbi:hypothetical protein B0H13DRAFT_1870079 [Mycena leptocephala]|nr:hypothetical protein B0H13DRAFT_1870079 [Mycena leptocephala]
MSIFVDVKGRIRTLSPIREFIRRIYPTSLTLSRPLRTYFQDLLELWNSKPQLRSSSLTSELVSYLGNINELILEGLFKEEKSMWTGIAFGIFTLDFFSGIMLNGDSPLMQRIPEIIEATGDAGLRWRYASCCLAEPKFNGLIDPDALIDEGVEYFKFGTQPTDQAQQRLQGTEYNTSAFALAQRAADIKLQLRCLDIEFKISYRFGNPSWAIDIAHRARRIGRFTSYSSEHDWMAWEAGANNYMGNLSHALDACEQAKEALISVGMGDSDKQLQVLDTQADVLFRKTQYIDARQIYAQIVKRTSPTRSPLYHAHSLCYMAYLDCLTGYDDAHILANVNVAEAIYKNSGSQRLFLCACVIAELKLRRGDTEDARSTFVGCLSKSRWAYQDVTGFCLAALGDPKYRMHETADTFRWAMVCLAFEQKMKDPVETVYALRRLADLYSILDDEETALNLFHAVLEAATKMDIYRVRAECMLGIGDIMIRRGDVTQAKEMWTGAHPHFLKASQIRHGAAVKKRLGQLPATESSALPVMQDGSVDHSTDSGSAGTLASDEDALEFRLAELGTISEALTPS